MLLPTTNPGTKFKRPASSDVQHKTIETNYLAILFPERYVSSSLYYVELSTGSLLKSLPYSIIVRNMQNSIETRGNLSPKLGPPSE